MTTKVKIELINEHMPVKVIASSGAERLPSRQVILRNKGDVYEEYVHSGQWLIVSEMSTEELFAEQNV